MKKILCLFAAGFAALAGFTATYRGASEDWVKRYVASYASAAQNSLIIAQDAETLAASPVVYTFTDPDDTNIVGQLTYTTATNIALFVSDSTVADVPNGTMWAWDNDGQRFYNKGFAFMPKLTKETRAVNLTSLQTGNTYVGNAVLYTGTDTNENSWVTYFDSGTYLRCGNDYTKRFRVTTVTVTESVKNGLLGASVATYEFVNPFTGERITGHFRACTDEGGGSADNASGSSQLTIKYKGVEYPVQGGTSPTDVLPCDVTDGNGNFCKKTRYDYEKWQDPENWGFTFPITITLGDGTTKSYGKGLFKQMSGWTEYVAAAIEQSRAAHLPHLFDEPHTHEHTCERGKDCKCEWTCKQKVNGSPCDFVCGKFLGHLGTLDERKLPTVVGERYCAWGCLNEQCAKHSVNHSLLTPITYEGVDPVTGEVKLMSDYHSCACGGVTGGHIRKLVSTYTKQDGTKISSYECDWYADGCGWTWDEIAPAEEHEHKYANRADDSEYCFVTIYTYNADGSIADQKECGAPRAHDMSGEYGGECKRCANFMNDGSQCPHIEHNGLWQDVGDDEYHCCSCGETIAGHGCENYTSREEKVEDGVDTIIYTIEEWDCPAPTSGCGRHFVETNQTGFVKGEGHNCSLSPYNQQNDGCEAADDRNPADCTCKRHPEHQLAHKKTEGEDLTYSCARCSVCGKSIDLEGANESKHSKKKWSLDISGTAKAEQKGHRCACGKYVAGHNFDKGTASRTAVDGKLVNCVTYTCEDCGFSYDETDEGACGHGYYELDADGEATGAFVSLWLDCVCQNCATNRAHAWDTANPIQQEVGICPKYGCKNENGAQYGGGHCSATTNLVSGTHYGWLDLTGGETGLDTMTNAEGHACYCGLKKTYHSSHDVTNGEYSCTIEIRCKDPPDGCSHLFGERHSANLITCGTNVLCKTCGRVAEYDANKQLVWVDGGGFAHSWGGKSEAEREQCVCDCTMMTNHYFAAERTTCACQCGASLQHIAGTDPTCYCTGAPDHEKVLIAHGSPLNYTRETTTNKCVTCGKNWTSWKDTGKCPVCGEVVKIVNGGGSHECTSGEVTSGTYHLSWGSYTDADGNEIEGGEEDGTWSGGGMSCLGAYHNGGSLSASGATIKIETTGYYSLRAKIDDSGSVSVGGLSASGGATWRDWGTLVYGYLDSGFVSVSAGAGSAQAIVGFAYELSYVGSENPEGDVR